MIHRINIDDDIDGIYYERNMVIDLKDLIKIIDFLISKEMKFATLKETLNDKKSFHLTFDDGYTEHIKAAKILKNRYNLQKDQCTFAINTGNSISEEYSGMDLIYHLINAGMSNKIKEYLNLSDKEMNIQNIKNNYTKLSSDQIKNMREDMLKDSTSLKLKYLNREQVKDLSKMFNIASHGITHRDLRYHRETSKKEISESRSILREITGQSIDVMCYPEGKNDRFTQISTEDSGYKYGLSINHEEGNDYSIGRYCINNHIDDFFEGIE